MLQQQDYKRVRMGQMYTCIHLKATLNAICTCRECTLLAHSVGYIKLQLILDVNRMIAL